MEEQAPKFQVSLYSCPACLPASFAAHTWFVTRGNDKLSRWEVLHRKNACATSWGHLHLNFFPPFSGIRILPVSWIKPVVPFFQKYSWKAKLLSSVEGGDGSLAARMAEFIENSPARYPYCNEYSLLGPNSNTYTQWVIDHFPESKMELPLNAVGAWRM